ncbi:hypothetical protein BGY98DRAFT_932580 [Russula aff. rugulosa BPL654]|nr:hypothetical protein BGY98DRAFT_932580 [Russula aff. rugulosa BPL654]
MIGRGEGEGHRCYSELARGSVLGSRSGGSGSDGRHTRRVIAFLKRDKTCAHVVLKSRGGEGLACVRPEISGQYGTVIQGDLVLVERVWTWYPAAETLIGPQICVQVVDHPFSWLPFEAVGKIVRRSDSMLAFGVRGGGGPSESTRRVFWGGEWAMNLAESGDLNDNPHMRRRPKRKIDRAGQRYSATSSSTALLVERSGLVVSYCMGGA